MHTYYRARNYEVSPAKDLASRYAVKYCQQILNLGPIYIVWISKKENGSPLVEKLEPIAGLFYPPNWIYLRADMGLNLNGIMNLTAHECRHMWQYQNCLEMDEEDAQAFAEIHRNQLEQGEVNLYVSNSNLRQQLEPLM